MTIVNPDRLKEMQRALMLRDRARDGEFVFAVTTTGIYCRPSCPARRPRPENVEYFETGEAARAAGFRPCKRCRPDEAARDTQAVQLALAAIRARRAPLSLSELAERTGYSPSHIQRVFKRQIGLTPAAYGRALRAELSGDVLSDGRRISDAIYESGFEAPSRFYESMQERLGMKPSVWAKGGQGVTIQYAIVQTSLAPMLVAATDKGVCRLSFKETAEDLRARFPRAELVEGGADFQRLLEKVIAELEQPGAGDDIPLDVKGTAFQEAIWQQLQEIPQGETRSYAELAAAAGRPKAVRAAGSANGANPVAVLIPCHRVVRSDGETGGYAYGSDIKAELLRREKAGKP